MLCLMRLCFLSSPLILVGALLQQEILLLPPTLLNPELEGAFIYDTHMTNVPTNPASSHVYVAP
jgi:hypothetical protein